MTSDNQLLSIDGDSLRIEDGNAVALSDLGTDDQNISGSVLTGSDLTIGIEDGTNEDVSLLSLASDSSFVTTLAVDSLFNTTLANDSNFIANLDSLASDDQLLIIDGDGDTQVHVEESGDEDNIRFDTEGSERMIIDNFGNVGIGTSNPSENLHVVGNTLISGAVQLSNYGAGAVQSDANGNSSVSSDERLKNIVADFEKGLETILALKPINYRWNALSGLEQEGPYTGFSAQNVQSVLPEEVGQDKKGYLTLSDRPIISALVNSIKTLNTKNEGLENENMALKETLKEVLKRLDKLEE
jgi:hypothetical protein